MAMESRREGVAEFRESWRNLTVFLVEVWRRCRASR